MPLLLGNTEHHHARLCHARLCVTDCTTGNVDIAFVIRLDRRPKAIVTEDRLVECIRRVAVLRQPDRVPLLPIPHVNRMKYIHHTPPREAVEATALDSIKLTIAQTNTTGRFVEKLGYPPGSLCFEHPRSADQQSDHRKNVSHKYLR